MTERAGAGRRSTDRELRQLAEDRKRLVEEHIKRTRRASRESRERTLTLRFLIVIVCGLVGVVSFGIAHTLPQLRSAQDQQVCAYRAIGNRESALALRDSPLAVRRQHRQNAETFRALERVASAGRTVRCRALINQGRR